MSDVGWNDPPGLYERGPVMPEEKKYKSLDEACADINRKKLLDNPPPPAPPEDPRWYSYTSNQNINLGSQPSEDDVEIPSISSREAVGDRTGFHYQKCRGGRRVIHKRLGSG